MAGGRSTSYNRKSSLADLISDTRKPKIIADTGWYKVGEDEPYEIPFEDGWNNSGGEDEEDAQWYQDGEGETKLKGVVTGGAVGTTIFTLPEENRPRGVQTYTCAVIGGGTANVAVYPNGEVVLESFN